MIQPFGLNIFIHVTILQQYANIHFTKKNHGIQKKSHATYTIQPLDFAVVNTMNALLINVCFALENTCSNATFAQMHEMAVFIILYICENTHAQQSSKTIQ